MHVRREGKVRHTEAEADAAGRALLLAKLDRDEVVALLPVIDNRLPGLRK